MRWLHPRRPPWRNPTVDEAVDEAKANLEHVRTIANKANEQAAKAEAALVALAAALMRRTDTNG